MSLPTYETAGRTRSVIDQIHFIAENVTEVLAYAADRFDCTYVKWSTSKLVLPDPPYEQNR